MADLILTERARQNFERHLIRADSGCLLWTAAVNRGGYGVFHFGQRAILAHRAAWFLSGRLLTLELPHVLHTCDTRRCCDLEHLWAGNKLLNMRDMSRKRRGRKSRAGLPFGVEQLPGGTYRARARVAGCTVHLGTFINLDVAAGVADTAKLSDYLAVPLPPLEI